MQVILQVAALTILLLIAQELLRRSGKWVVWALFMLLPLVLTPYWLTVNSFGPFLWLKIYTIVFSVCWGAVLGFTPLGCRPQARLTIPVLLVINILEATTVDALERGWAHDLNAIAGFLLLVTMPRGLTATTVKMTNRTSDVHYATSRGWVVGYTLWNWAFVCLNFPSLTGHHTAVLASSLIVGMVDPRRWIQARTSTLGFNLLASATFFTPMTSWLDTSNCSEPWLGVFASGLALAFMIGLTIRTCRPIVEANLARWTHVPSRRMALTTA